MGQKLHSRVETWKKLLLDFGKRNRLINFLEGKRNNVKITSPSYDILYERIVNKEEEMIFPDAVPTLRTFVSENSSGVQMSNFMEIIHDFKTSKNNTILLFVYITYFMNFATKLYMLIYE